MQTSKQEYNQANKPWKQTIANKVTGTQSSIQTTKTKKHKHNLKKQKNKQGQIMKTNTQIHPKKKQTRKQGIQTYTHFYNTNIHTFLQNNHQHIKKRTNNRKTYTERHTVRQTNTQINEEEHKQSNKPWRAIRYKLTSRNSIKHTHHEDKTNTHII